VRYAPVVREDISAGRSPILHSTPPSGSPKDFVSEGSNFHKLPDWSTTL